MFRNRLALLLVFAAVGLTGCSGCDPKPDDPTPCAALGATCAAAGDCCAPNSCDTGLGECVAPGSCAALGEYCTGTSDCCDGDCFGNECIVGGSCVALAAACSTAPGATPCCEGSCVSGTCNAGSTICVDDFQPCTPATADLCCSKICNAANVCAPSFCQQAGEGCATGTDCCSLNCVDGICRQEDCLQIGDACTNKSSCCSGTGSCSLTSSGLCEAVRPGATNFTCKTLGEACATGVDCCSTNCQAGRCAEASSCNSYGDICVVGTDCCSGLCDTSAGTPGRCIDPSGGCVQSGNPCSGPSNCCTRLCEDPGTGVTVCALPGGCRMTGEYCDSTDACCNINFAVPTSQWVQCTTTDNRCDNGGACNPPGNICGAGDANASQNCCDGKKEVCKADANGIWRCFGGATTICPKGWDANDPACCIPTGTGPESICQFRDQCCGFAPCVPDANGVLHCTETITSCLPAGAHCTGAGTPCCSPYGCKDLGTELGFRCAEPGPNPPGCAANGAICSVNGDCCDGFCVDDACALCLPDGNATCTADAQCCNGVCADGVCTSQCLPAGSRCTQGGGTACCGGFSCIDMGLELGFRCSNTGPGGCGILGTSCGANADCCSGICNAGTCALCLTNNSPTSCTSSAQCCSGNCDTTATPDTCKPQCVPESGICTVNGDCCQGMTCEGTNGGLNPGTCELQTRTCALTDESCATLSCCDTTQVCDAVTKLCHDPVSACSDAGQGCAITDDCCTGLGLDCLATVCSIPYVNDCVAEGGTIITNADCTDVNAISPCTCAVKTCKTEGQGCGPTTPCCTIDPGTEQPLTCVGSVCTAPATCSPSTASCSLAQPCCAGSRSTCSSNTSPYPACTSTSTADCYCKPAG